MSKVKKNKKMPTRQPCYSSRRRDILAVGLLGNLIWLVASASPDRINCNAMTIYIHLQGTKA